MKATITIQDGEDGTFRVDTDYEGGFTVDSHAHQHALLLIKHLGAIAERRGETQVVGPTQELRDELAQAMDEPVIEAVPVDYVEAAEPQRLPALNG